MAKRRRQYTFTYKGRHHYGKVIGAALGIGGLSILGIFVYKNWSYFMGTVNSALSGTVPQRSAIRSGYTGGAISSSPTTTSPSYFGIFSNQQWLPYVYKFASQYNVAPSLILGVIQQESTGAASALSGQGAIGLMQVLPTTAQSIMGQTISAAQLMNPMINIQVGTAYLANMLSQFSLLPYAIAAYNAGPGNASYYQHTLGYIPSATSGDNVYGYVTNVINNANIAAQSGALGVQLSLNSPSAAARLSSITASNANMPPASTYLNSLVQGNNASLGTSLSPYNSNLFAFKQNNATVNNSLGFPNKIG